MTCRFVPLAIPLEKLPNLKHIDSINDLIDNLDHSLEKRPPKWIHGEKVGELDFFVNCSNLQVWVEHDFDTRLLDYRLSFPLLRALAERNARACMRYHEELIERCKTARTLNLSGYLKERIDHDFSWEEKLDLLQPSERTIVVELVEKYDCHKKNFKFDFKTGTISKLNLSYNSQIQTNGLPSYLKELKGIKELDLSSDGLSSLPEWLRKLTTLKDFGIVNNSLRCLPDWFSELVTIEDLHLTYTDLETLPDNFGDLSNLKYLSLNYNKLQGLPGSFRRLQKLKVLKLIGCGLEKFPEQVLSLSSLEELHLEQNNLSALPDLSAFLSNLKKITLTKNKFLEYPEHLSHHPSLKDIYIEK